VRALPPEAVMISEGIILVAGGAGGLGMTERAVVLIGRKHFCPSNLTVNLVPVVVMRTRLEGFIYFLMTLPAVRVDFLLTVTLQAVIHSDSQFF